MNGIENIISMIISILGLIVSSTSILIAFKIYDNQCKHIYRLNYNRISYSNLSIEIMSIQDKIIDEIDACTSDIDCYMRNTNYRRIDAMDDMGDYIKNIGKLISNYISVISIYIDALLECNEYKKSEAVKNSIDIFKNNIKELNNKYTLSKFKDTNGMTVNFTLQSLSSEINSRLFNCIDNYSIDVKSFTDMMNNIKELVKQSQRISKDSYTFTIQDIKYILEANNISKDAYELVFNNYKNTVLRR